MVAVPFIYFTILTIYWWIKHRGLDVCVYMSALFAVTAFCCIIVVTGGMLDGGGILFDEFDIELNLIPTMLYCALITMGIFPFSLIYNKDIKRITYTPSLVLEGLCWLLILVAIINFYLIVDTTAEILSGDLSSVRNDHYEGFLSPADIKAQSLPSIFGYILYFRGTTVLALPLFFYYNCFSDKAWWFKALLIVTSISLPLYCMQMADRTEFTFYGLMFIFCLIFFWNFLSKRFKRNLFIIGSPFAVIILVYLVAVSQARFAKGSDNDKVFESALQYAGQNYLNFCYFWENGKFEHITLEREFPFITKTLTGVESSAERRGERSVQQGFFMSVFATFAGDIMLDLSPFGAVLWFLVFFVFCLSTIRYAHKEEYDVGDIMAIFTLAAIPIFGIFYYRYYAPMNIYMFACVIVLFVVSKVRIIYQ